MSRAECPVCEGSGLLLDSACPLCDGASGSDEDCETETDIGSRSQSKNASGEDLLRNDGEAAQCTEDADAINETHAEVKPDRKKKKGKKHTSSEKCERKGTKVAVEQLHEVASVKTEKQEKKEKKEKKDKKDKKGRKDKKRKEKKEKLNDGNECQRVTGAVDADSFERSCMQLFLDLPEVADAIGSACCDPWLLCRLSMTSPHMKSTIGSIGFVAQRAVELGAQGMPWARDCWRLEQFAVGLTVAEACGSHTKNHLYFPYGGGVDVRRVTRPLLTTAAALSRCHRRLRLHVDAHCGRGAPSGVAVRTAQERAERVAQGLVIRGAQEHHITYRSWGKAVSSRWSEPEDDRAARAELYFRLDGLEFPPRPAYYELVPEDLRPTECQADSAYDEAGLERRRTPRTVMQLVRLSDGQLVPLAALLRAPGRHRREMDALDAEGHSGSPSESSENDG